MCFWLSESAAKGECSGNCGDDLLEFEESIGRDIEYSRMALDNGDDILGVKDTLDHSHYVLVSEG